METLKHRKTMYVIGVFTDGFGFTTPFIQSCETYEELDNVEDANHIITEVLTQRDLATACCLGERYDYIVDGEERHTLYSNITYQLPDEEKYELRYLVTKFLAKDLYEHIN